MMQKYFFTLGFLILAGCQSGNCRSHAPQTMDEKSLAQESTKLANASQTHIKVFKYDGSKQCGIAKGISVAEMQKELKDITVYSAQSKSDGLMHIQACGTNTGQANVYEIDLASLETAKKLGFKEWTAE